MQTTVLFLVITCSALAQAAMPLRDLKMLELYKNVKRLDTIMQHHGSPALNNPGTDIKECCLMSALECYRSQLLKVNSSTSASLHYKVCKSLSSSLRPIFEKLKGINASSKDCQKSPQCQSCDSYPNTDSKEFMAKLISLLAMANNN